MTSSSTHSSPGKQSGRQPSTEQVPPAKAPGGPAVAIADAEGTDRLLPTHSELRVALEEAQAVDESRGRSSGDTKIHVHPQADAWLATSLTVVVLAWLLLAPPANIPVLALVACTVAQALASSIEFEIGPGSAVATTPVLIVSLFLLPPQLVPVMAIAGMALASLIRRLWDLGRDRLSITVGSSFYALGPALVFFFAGVSTPRLGEWPIYVAAAAAQIAFDATSSWFLNCYRLGLPLAALRVPLGFTYLVDLLLIPLGYAAVFAAPGSVASLLLLSPVLLLWILQRDRRRQVDRAILLATRDPLTGLPNRDLFHRRLDENLAGSQRLAVLLIDLDRFKEVNDTLGHARGDEVLVEVGRRLLPQLLECDMVARLGGDEFAVFLYDVGETAAMARAQNLLEEIRRPFAVGGFDVDVDASIGVVLTSEPGMGATDLLRRADVAMYTAKDDHTGLALYSYDRDHYSAQRLALAGRLRQAIAEGELVLHYQPQVDLATGKVIAVEALVRWQPPGQEMIPPDDFIGLAERTDLIHPLTRFVLTQAIDQAACWHRAGRNLRVAVNLSPRNLNEGNLVESIDHLLKTRDLAPQALEVELTESTVMANPAQAVEVMNRLRAIGVQIAIDDFGTGHSALSYLTALPTDVLKVDRSFIQAMEFDQTAETVVKAIVDLARRLGLGVVAEGVETQTAVRALHRMGCSTVQGYYYSRPLTAEAFDRWIALREADELDLAGSPEGPVLRAL
jgi:diguanylate cyclase (GGDEF)-like protein